MLTRHVLPIDSFLEGARCLVAAEKLQFSFNRGFKSFYPSVAVVGSIFQLSAIHDLHRAAFVLDGPSILQGSGSKAHVSSSTPQNARKKVVRERLVPVTKEEKKP